MSDEKKPKLFIASPMFGVMCHGVYAQSMLTTPATLNNNNIEKHINETSRIKHRTKEHMEQKHRIEKTNNK